MAIELDGSTYDNSNLKAYYKFDNGAITTDSSGNSYTLTNSNSVANDSGGQFGYCATTATNNTNKVLYINNACGVTATSAKSISFWVKMNEEPGSGTQDRFYQYILGGATGTSLWIEYQNNSGTYRLRYAYYGAPAFDKYYNVTLGTTNWHHIAMTFDGTNAIGYYDGNVVASSAAATGTLNLSGYTDQHTYFSAHTGAPGQFASCKLDDVGLFNDVLSGTEVTDIYSGTATPATIAVSRGFMTTNTKFW